MSQAPSKTISPRKRQEYVRSYIRRKCRNCKCRHCFLFYFHSLLLISPWSPRLLTKGFLEDALCLYHVLYRDWDESYNKNQRRRFFIPNYLKFYTEVQGLISRYYSVSWNNAVHISTLHRDLSFTWIDCQHGKLSIHTTRF